MLEIFKDVPLALAVSLAAMAIVIVPAWAAQPPSPRPGSPAAAKRLDAWQVIGPGGGGAQYYPTISALDPKKALVRCDMTGAYITADGGDSWRMFNLRGTVGFFVIDPVDANVMYAKTIVLWRSADGGKTWNLLHPDPSKVKGVAYVGDHAGERVITTDGSRDSVTALAVDPGDSKTLYAGISGKDGVGLSISTDWGKTWKNAGPLPNGAAKIYVDPKSPKGSRTIYVIGRNATSVLKGGQWTHNRPPVGAGDFIDASAGFAASGGPAVVYAVTDARWQGNEMAGGVLVSKDGGATWNEAGADFAKKVFRPSSRPVIRGVGCCLTEPDVAYIGYKVMPAERGGTVYFGTAKTVDSGKTWQILAEETDPGDAAPNVRDGWMDERFGPIWGDAPRYLGVAPTNPDICYTTDDGRTMRTADGGKTWDGVYSKRTADGTWTTAGLDVTTCYGVHFDPFDSKRIFISYTDIGAFRSENGGASWTSATADGVPREWINTTYWMEFDPKVKGRVWAVMTGVHDLPRPKMWRSQSPANYSGGVCISDDGGKTWRRSTQGMPETAPTHVLLDPESPVDARVVYVTGFGTGVWKSTDGGKSWRKKNAGIEGAEPFCWRLARDLKGVLYCVVARRTEDGSIGGPGDGALYRSTDGAERWQKVALPDGVNGPNGLAIDPADTKRMYLAAWGRSNPNGDTNGGIYLTADGGKSWKNVLSRDQHVYDVTVDPRDAKKLYATGFESSVWRSTDSGETWTRIKGFNFKWGHRVICDAYNADMIFVATFGGSVWYGPAAGDPKALEDIATQVMKVHP